MTSVQSLAILVIATLWLLLRSSVHADGYHYSPPAPPAPRSLPTSNSGHYFASIPTVAPLPPVPALPSLPTGPVHTQARNNAQTASSAHTQVRTLVQVHPSPGPVLRLTPVSAPPQPPRPPTHRPTAYNTITGNYREPSFELRPGYPNGNGIVGHPPETQLFLTAGTTPSPPLVGLRYPASALPAHSSATDSVRFTPAAPQQAAPQPIRIPFGKQPVLTYATGPERDFYVVNGRQLKQYAVVEFVDNDISQDTKPFLSQSFVNNYRAQVGASGTGAIAPLPSAMQLDSAANAILREQQRLAQQGSGTASDTIALGSGGIGFVRLPDGSVTLGSGSLNFITGQQHLAQLRNARTRSESLRDPLHFGHGPLEVTSNHFRFK